MFTPIYTTVDNVKVRLAGKVQFQADANSVAEGELPDALLTQLIVEAETKVENDLRSRYAIPFRSKTTGQYEGLPNSTKRSIIAAVVLQSVIVVLTTDFGRGTHISGSSYSKDDQEAYDNWINDMLGRDPMGRNDKIDRFKHSPPLEDLMLAASNSKADDGYRGAIINTDASDNGAEGYAGQQINNPAQSYINSRRGLV